MKSSRTLNDEQRRLVELNHNLIYSFLRSKYLSMDSVEDWYGVAAIGLCKAALVYDENREAKFSTLAYICMNNEVRMVLRKKRINNVISLYTETTEDKKSYIEEIIPDTYDFTYSVYLNDAISSASKNLTERNQKILNLIIDNGMKCSEVAVIFGISKQMVNRIYHNFISKIKDYFDECSK